METTEIYTASRKFIGLTLESRHGNKAKLLLEPILQPLYEHITKILQNSFGFDYDYTDPTRSHIYRQLSCHDICKVLTWFGYCR